MKGFIPSTGPYGEGGHAGIDIALAPESEVRASAPGMVSFSGSTPLGICVSILHAGDFKTTYVSLRSSAVHRGERVEAGQVIGKSDGVLDRSSPAPHLHFGLFLKGVAVDPLLFLRGALLDPRSLFLGPWEDARSARAYMERHGGGNLPGWVERGFGVLKKAVVEGTRAVVKTLGRGLAVAWEWTCRLARTLGRAAVKFYRVCLEPWLSPLLGAAGRALKAVLSNRFVQAVLAGLAAAAAICLAVAGLGLLLGLSLASVLTACVVGGATSLGYAVYYASASGDSFSFLGCFLGSLAIGGAAAGGCLLFSCLAPAAAAGWANLGWLGFGKGFLAHGMANLLVYSGFSLATGRGVSPGGLLVSFLVGGLTGGMGRLLVSGILSGGAVQGLAAGFLSSGGSLLGGGAAAQVAAYAGAWISGISQKLAYMLFCGCAGALGDLVLRAATGGRPSLLESLLSFGGGFLAGGISLLGRGQGLGALVSRLSGGRLKISGEFARALAGKALSGGLKEGAKSLLGRLRGGGRAEESLRLLDAGREPAVR
ncbi:M23 family metallopeptidase [Candidatus Solincola sp.]|nr:M23 family metallopeptidase [Actinomycetota bacterium]MDI7251918.1 M23 family metallopeptidase [Actinomycetota bacterium]